MSIRFNDPNLQEVLEAFLHFGTHRIKKLEGFNEDVKSMEKLFKSYGLATFSVEVEKGLSRFTLEWSEMSNRIMYVTPTQNRPLAETEFVLRDAARREDWLREIFEEAVEELRKLNEHEGDDRLYCADETVKNREEPEEG